MKKIIRKKNKACPPSRGVGSRRGFTLIETMVALSLFLIIIIAGMGALLNANALYQKSQSMRSIIDSLSFMIEDMSRNLREGYHYRCLSVDADLDVSVIGVPQSGQNCWGIAFEPADGDISTTADQVVYIIGTRTVGGVVIKGIFKSTKGGAIDTWVALNSEEVVVDGLVNGIQVSGFSILGAEPPNIGGTADKQQPFVVIKLVGSITFQGNKTPFYLQTSASQRYIDVPSGT